MKFRSFSPWLRSWLNPWLALLAVILIIKAILSLTLRQSSGAATYNAVVYFLLLLLATRLAVRNAIKNLQGNRPFWVFLAAGTGLWSLDQVLYLYYVNGLHTDVTDSSIADPALFLHIVPFMAAVAVRPFSGLSPPKLSRTTLN